MLMENEGGLKPIAGALRSNIVPIATEPTHGMVMIIARPGLERRACDSLRRRGVGAWWPNYPKDEVYKDQQTGKRQSRRILSAVMPGIILSPGNYERFWEVLDLAPGVVNVARKAGGDLLVLDDLEVVLIHKIEVGLNSPLVIGKSVVHSFKVGDKVRFVDDVMRRFPSGKVTKIAKSGHIMVEVAVLGRPTIFDVLAHQIEPVLEESKRIRA